MKNAILILLVGLVASCASVSRDAASINADGSVRIADDLTSELGQYAPRRVKVTVGRPMFEALAAKLESYGWSVQRVANRNFRFADNTAPVVTIDTDVLSSGHLLATFEVPGWARYTRLYDTVGNPVGGLSRQDLMPQAEPRADFPPEVFPPDGYIFNTEDNGE